MKNGVFSNIFSLFFALVVAAFCRWATSSEAVERLSNATDERRFVLETSEEERNLTAKLENSENNVGARRGDPLRRDKAGVQTLYPGVCKIVGRGGVEKKEDGAEATPLYYGTGSFVAEFGELGLVLTNWHVVSEANETIEVVFPNFSSPAKIILRDEIWDLSALLIRKPPEVAPIPIALEVPKLGEILWVAGYGQTGGLTDFQIGSGPLLNYVSLVDPENLPIETLAIGAGVRQGDSGGPIFNRYGEIAGILWGSDGKVTMGTLCVRVQFFLSQAIRRAIKLAANASEEMDATLGGENWCETFDFLSWDAEFWGAVARDSEILGSDGLRKSGVFPISQRTIYVSPDGELDAETLSAEKREAAINMVERAATSVRETAPNAPPPSPPIFSPTFVVQQRNVKRIRPEIADAGFYENLIAAANLIARQRKREVEENSENASGEALLTGVRETAPVASLEGMVGRFGDLSVLPVGDANPLNLVLNDAPRAKGLNGTRDASLENSSRLAQGDGLNKFVGSAEDDEDENSENIVAVDENATAENADVEDASVGSETALKLDAFSDLKIYLVICVIFCLFYNAGRLMVPKNLANRDDELAN